MDVFLTILVLCCGLAPSAVAEDMPKWPDAVSVSYELISMISDFGMTVKHYLSRSQKSARWDINGGSTKIYVTYNETSTSGMYYYYPITTAIGTNATACYFIPMYPLNATAEVPTVLADLSQFRFDRYVTVHGIKAEKWVKNVGSEWEEIQNIYVHHKNDSGKKEPVLVQAELMFYMDSIQNRLWTHNTKVFHDYDPSEPNPEVWRRPKDVRCKVIDEDAGEYMMYLADMYLGLPSNPILDQLYVGEIYYLSLKQTNVRMKKWSSIPSSCEGGLCMMPTDHSETSDEALSQSNGAGELPASWDWRDRGAVTEVRDQGICRGSGWAFGVVGAMEGANFLKTQKLVKMSEQALVDCSWDFGNSGCFRGSPENAFRWIQQNGGVVSAQDYGKFQEGHGYCQAAKFKTIAPIKGFVRVPPHSDAVKSALVKHGPLVVGIYTPYDLHFHTYGLYETAEQGATDHYVVLVGYGSLNGEKYWLIKNSWSINWGNKGYAMISAEHNMLNLLDSVYYVDT